ncbi:MAG: PKD domain-containing protein [Bacteroidota bacterium]|nr:PKD domain-containing protein [Bacteroidota bacterium]
MKKNLQVKTIWLSIVLLIVVFPMNIFAQLSGSYTINPNQSVSNTNYLTWESAISDLVNGTRNDGGTAQGAGVSGPVVITVYDTIYSVNLEIANITNSSATNTITFRSTSLDSTRCLLTNASSSSATNDYVVHLYGVDHVRFRGIGFERTGTNTYCTVVQISNDADNNQFQNCFFKGRKMPSSSSLGFIYGVGSCIHFTGNADSTLVKNSRLLYGYNGIYGTSSSSGNLFAKNIIDTSGCSGIYMTNQSRFVIDGNDFRMGDFGSNQGHYVSYAMRIESSPSLKMINNKVQMLAKNGQVVRAIVVANTTSTSSIPTLIYNNFIFNGGGTGDCTGLAIYLCNYLNFHHNNVLINSSLSASAAYYHYPQYTNSYIRIVNNNMVNKGSGFAISVPGTNISDIDSLDYNNHFSNGTYIGQWNASSYTSMSNWKSNTSMDANSLNVDPGYTSNADLHVANISLNGKAMISPWVKTDIDGDIRDINTPDIGADEFFPKNIDVGINNIDSPSVFCAGIHKVKVKFQNYGSDTIKSLTIQWKINSNNQTSYNWTGILAPGSSSPSIDIGTFTFASNTPYNFIIWTINPNNLSDQKTLNDTLKITKYAGLTGNYTIGDTIGTDFKSFNDAITGMSSRGVCGPITFNVKHGVYNEQITLTQLPGMGINNPVKFKNITNDSTKIVITLPSTTATGNNNATLQLRGADYITFEGITFMRTGTNPYGHVIHILNGANSNQFLNCQMIGLRPFIANLNAINIWSDQSRDDNNHFINNLIKFGTYNMLYQGDATNFETGTIIEGNTFDSAYNYAVSIINNNKISVKKNTFKNVITSITGNYNIQLLRCNEAINIDGNYFGGQNTETALLLSRCIADVNSNGYISNNMIVKSIGKGIYLDSVQYQKLVFNSMNFTTNSSANAGIFTSGIYNSNLEIKNNNIVMAGGDALYIVAGNQISSCSHNNLYTKGNEFAYWGTSVFNLAGLVSVSGQNQNSLSLNPYFNSSSDLHIINPSLKGTGVRVLGITRDFDNEIRDTIRPDIGADEFMLSKNDAGVISLFKPSGTECAGIYQVEVIIKNFGIDTLKSIDVNWIISNNVQPSFKWTGNLLNGKSDTVTLGLFNFTSLNNPKYVLWTSNPNGQSDGFVFNDSFIINRSLQLLPNANAGTDQTICQGTIIGIGPNSLNGHSYLWNDLTNQTVYGYTSRVFVDPFYTNEYELIVTNNSSRCSRRDTIVVTVNPKPLINAGANKNICLGDSVQIGTNTQNGFSYKWTSNPSGYSSTKAVSFVKPTQNTIYILEKTFDASSCSALDTIEVKVNSIVKNTITGVISPCLNTNHNYSSNLNQGNTYQWMVLGGQLISGQNTHSINMKWNDGTNGSLKLIETNSFGCKDSASISISIKPLPVSKFRVTDVCLGNVSNFVDSSINAVSYNWNFGDGNTSSVKSPKHTYSQIGSYTVRNWVESNDGCRDTSFKILSINALPTANFRFEKNDQLTFIFTDTSLENGNTITNWTWDFGDGNFSQDKNPEHTYTSEASFSVKLCVKTEKDCEHCITKVISAVGINNLNKNQNINLYPNPTFGICNISSNQIIQSIKLIGLDGKTMLYSTPENLEYQLDINEFNSGIYQLEIITEIGIQHFKVILSK